MKICRKTYETVRKRQPEGAYGSYYEPAIKAIRGEAPAKSRPSILKSAKLSRELHLLSIPERIAAQFALYHPALFDLHEQKMLSPVATGHPLLHHPIHGGLRRAKIRGTIDIYSDLGQLKAHPRFNEETDNDWKTTPYPLIGDLLLFLCPAERPAYCVNWTVKHDDEDFLEKDRQRLKTLKTQKRDIEKAYLRHKVEELYYQEAGIRTLRVAKSTFCKNMTGNLNFLFLWQLHPINLEVSLLQDFTEELIISCSAGDSAKNVIDRYLRYAPYQDDQFRGAFYRLIWNRKLRLNLFQPIVIDNPMELETKSPLDVYNNFFSET
ncbi:hypothetical protein [Pseudomonas putida]